MSSQTLSIGIIGYLTYLFILVCLTFKSAYILAFTNLLPYQGPMLVIPTEPLTREEMYPASQNSVWTLPFQPRPFLSLWRRWHTLWGGHQTQHLLMPGIKFHAQFGCWGTAHTLQTHSLKVQNTPFPESSHWPFLQDEYKPFFCLRNAPFYSKKKG